MPDKTHAVYKIVAMVDRERTKAEKLIKIEEFLKNREPNAF